MTKKILAVVMAIAMLLCMAPITLAAEGNVAKDKNGVEYATLAEAVANGTSPITLLRDAEGAGVVINRSITIDFAGYTYTFTEGVGSTGTESNGFQILAGSYANLKNGTLNVAAESADKFYTLIQTYAGMSITDMTLDGTNLDKWSKTDGDSYVLSVNSGDIKIAGNTNIIANNDGNKAFAFDSCKYASYEAPFVKVDTTGTISGIVEITGGDLEVEAGTFVSDTDCFYMTSGYLWLGEDVTVTAGECGVYLRGGELHTYADITATGSYGAIQGNGNYAGDVYVYGGSITSENDLGIYFPQNGLLCIFDGTITGTTAVYAKQGQIFVNGGTLVATGEAKDFVTNGNGADATGDALVIETGHYGDLYAQVDGGTFVSENASAIASYAENENYTARTAFVNNAVIDGNIDTALLAEDATVEFVKVATVNGVAYETLAEAVAAAEPGATVTLLTDATGAALKIDKDITIDFGGNTYTITNPAVGSTGTTTLGMQLLKDNDIVLKNGKLEVAAESATDFAMLIQNYANLTIEDMILDGTNLDRHTIKDYDYSYVLSNNSGEVAINGATDIIANDDGTGYAFDVCKYASYAVPTVTVNTTGTINGIVVVEGGNLVAEAGTFVSDGYAIRVIDGTADLKEGVSVTGDCAIFVKGGSLTTAADVTSIEGGDFAAISGNGYYAGDITITGGTITDDGVAVYFPQNGKLTITGGTITGTTAVYAKQGTVDISGGTLIATGEAAEYNYNGNGANATGDALVIDTCGYGDIDVAVTGGTFVSANAAGIASYATTNYEAATGFVSGGTIDAVVTDNAILADNADVDIVRAYASAIVTNADSYGTLSVNGNVVTLKAEGTVGWKKSATGKYGNWVGFRINVPEGVDAATAIYTRPNGTSTKLANILDTPAYSNVYSNMATYGDTATYYLDWNGDGVQDLTVVIDVTNANLITPHTDAISTNADSYGDLTVNGTVVTLNAEGTIKWLKNAVGKYGNWVGFRITTPEGVDANTAIYTRPNGKSSTLASVLDSGKNYASVYSNMATYGDTATYYLDWNGDGVQDLTVVIDVTNATLAKPVAKIGNNEYTSLEAAAAAAKAGDTITLVDDVTYAADGGADNDNIVWIDLTDVTLDLNGKTINANRLNPVFEGKNFTIKNGNVMTEGADYGLWIGGAENVIVDGITTNAGIEVWASSNVTLKNNDVTGDDYYAVYTETTTGLVIESGSYIAKEGKKALYVANSSTATVTGGTWSTDVSAYLAEGLEIVENADGTFGVQEKAAESGLLTLKAQTNKAGTQLRFVTTIDTLAYKQVGFVITNNDIGKTITKTSSVVYSSIVAGNKTVTAAQISGDEDMNYILTFTIKGITAATQDVTYTVKPFVVTLDGETVYGEEKTFCVADMIG